MQGRLFFPRPWMGLVVGFHERIEIDVSIPLRRREARMSEKFLNCPQISSGFKQMSREAVTQRMGACFWGQAK